MQFHQVIFGSRISDAVHFSGLIPIIRFTFPPGVAIFESTMGIPYSMTWQLSKVFNLNR